MVLLLALAASSGWAVQGLAGQTDTQEDAKLSDYLAGHPWDPGHAGPLVVIDPVGTRGGANAKSLAAFHRKQKTIGNISAIVPDTMVVIDDSFQQTPNMSDGLDLNAKVLYLLSTLDNRQWPAVLKNGIGVSDLNPEQQKVFASILPMPFSWHSFEVADSGRASNNSERVTLSPQERSEVRLVVGRQLSFAVHLQGQPNSYAFLSSPGAPPHSTVYARDVANRPEVFGLQLKSSVPNELKPSNLDYSQFKEIVTVPAHSTIKEVLATISSLTKTEITADLRIADLPVWSYGTSMLTGDLLKALALGVTGTYRKVGGVYDLTSDLVGLGTRKVLFGLWLDDLNREQSARTSEWLKTVGARGRITKATFDPNDPAVPSPEMFSPEDDSAPSPNHWIPEAQLTPGIRQALSLLQARVTTGFDFSGVALSSEYRYSFILPSGQKLRFEGSLGRTVQYRNPPLPTRLPGAVYVDSPPPLQGSKSILAMAPKTPVGFKEVADLAVRKGIPELWVETDALPTLRATIDAARSDHLQIRLMVHPWSLPSSQKLKDPDRTILGEAADRMTERVRQASSWDAGRRSGSWIGDWEEPSMSPTDGGLRERWQKIFELAKSPGLSGVVLIGSTPSGYDGRRPGRIGQITPSMRESVDFGYSTEERVAFLRANGVDPIDIPFSGTPIRADIRQPFFPDSALDAGQRPRDSQDAAQPENGAIQEIWAKFRSELNRRSIQELLDLLDGAGIPTMIEPPDTLNLSPFAQRSVVPWSKSRSPLSTPENGPLAAQEERTVFFDFSGPDRPIPYQTSRATMVIALGWLSNADAKESVNRAFVDKAP